LRATCLGRRHWCCKWSDEDRSACDRSQVVDIFDKKLGEKAAGNEPVDVSGMVVIRSWSNLDFVSIHLCLPLTVEDTAFAKEELRKRVPAEAVAVMLAQRHVCSASLANADDSPSS
jgi:hypothetical protein